jgi:hypothetical protein
MDNQTDNLLIIHKNHSPEWMFCALRLTNSYQIDGHSYSAGAFPLPAVLAKPGRFVTAALHMECCR